jgi:predicted secreted Zn-dependent protease
MPVLKIVQRLSAIVISASAFVTSAHSADTEYTYYLIAGQSAASLHLSMVRQGPRVQAGHAYASTRMEPRITFKTHQEGGICRVEQFKLNMKFTIRLPKLKKSATLSPELRRSFESFYQSAKQHEETHRSIWLECGREIEALARAITASTCSEAELLAFHMFSDIAQSCDEQQLSFDYAEQQRIARHRFIKLLSKE